MKLLYTIFNNYFYENISVTENLWKIWVKK